MLEGNHYLRLRKPNQPQTRLVTDSPDKDQYLNDFIWVSGQWEFPADEPGLFSVPRHRGYVLDSIDASGGGVIGVQTAISAANNCGRSRKVSDLLGYVRGQGVHCLTEVSDLFEGTSAELRRLLEEAEGESSGSSKSSSSSWDVDLGDEGLNEEAEVEDGERDSDIAIVEPREIVEHSYSHSGSSSSESQGNEEIMAPKVRILGKGQAPRTEPPMLPEAPDSSMQVPAEDQSIAPSSMVGGKCKEKQPAEGTSRQKKGKGAGSATGTPELWAPNLPLWSSANRLPLRIHLRTMRHALRCSAGNAVMLPQDVADHAAEITTKFGGKLVMLGAQLFQRAVSSSLQLKQGAVDLKKANQKANSLEKELKQTKSELADARSAAEIAIL
ncbi:hypothetical protein Acr_25g0000110 [Actinidia rufa]|uniref:Uncharacterized protein n=1 Tax=Actinidia rufa TaxID=165716 RepID=A0A7J0GXS7_9ERIC|nr:hypothetical protein Acr_25g0000110 [Actinidia rufa]